MTVLALDGSFQLFRMKSVAGRRAYDKYNEALKSGKSEDEAFEIGKKEATWKSMVWLLFRSLVPMMEEFHPTRVFYLWDEGQCKYRVALDQEYKGDRIDQNEPSKMDQWIYLNFITARNYVHEFFPSIGIGSIKVPGVEADDWGYYISHKYDDVTLVSDDKDWKLNLRPVTKLFRPMALDPVTKEKGVIYEWSHFEEEQNEQFFIEHNKILISQMIASATNNEIKEYPRKYKKVNPRVMYLHYKACWGGKDNLERITTASPATEIARYVAGMCEDLRSDLKDLLESKRSLLELNLKLADTSWICRDATDFNADEVHDDAVARIVIGDQKAFYKLASELNLLNYLGRWPKAAMHLT